MMKLLKENPKAAKLIHDYYVELMIESSKDLPDHFKEYVKDQGLEMSNIASMLEAAPRNLFDVFDKHQIMIVIDFMPDLGLYGQFTAIVNGEMSGTSHSERKEADKDAVEMAIEMLEVKLNSLEETNQDS